MWIGGERPSAVGVRKTTDRADVHALVHRFEEARERSGALPIGNVSRACRHDEPIIGGVPRQPPT